MQVLNRALEGTRFADGLQHFASVGSTNTMLLDAASAGAHEGLVYVADEQTAGRGRGGHAWHSAPGDGLYVSALVKPALAPGDALLLSLATGLAMQQAVHEVTATALDIRWPNDLMLLGSDRVERKCGGILVEAVLEPGENARLRYAVIGVGVNVHHPGFPPELADLATSLAREGCAPAQLFRAPILIAFLRNLDLELERLEQDGAASRAALLERVEDASSWVRGKRVRVPEQGGYTGTTSGLDSRGFLLVDCDDGERRTVLSGGVRSL